MCYPDVQPETDGTFTAVCYCMGVVSAGHTTEDDAERDVYAHWATMNPNDVEYATYDEWKHANNG